MNRLGMQRGRPQAARRALAAGLGVLALVLALAGSAGPAQANGTPIRIVLSYLNGVSNFGPQNATGTAELITSEGEVRLTAAGLQKLPDNEQYRLWIVSNTTNERMSLATFDATETPNGTVSRVDVVLRDPIPEKPWDLMVVTVEARGSEPTAPSQRRAIAGRFPTVPGGGAQPAQLPNTGGPNTGGPNTGGESVPTAAPVSGVLGLSTGGTALLLLLLAGVVGFALGRAGARRGA